LVPSTAMLNSAVALSPQSNSIDPSAERFVVRFFWCCVVRPSEAV
jgi:hypothetical protein